MKKYSFTVLITCNIKRQTIRKSCQRLTAQINSVHTLLYTVQWEQENDTIIVVLISLFFVVKCRLRLRNFQLNYF